MNAECNNGKCLILIKLPYMHKPHANKYGIIYETIGYTLTVFKRTSVNDCLTKISLLISNSPSHVFTVPYSYYACKKLTPITIYTIHHRMKKNNRSAVCRKKNLHYESSYHWNLNGLIWPEQKEYLIMGLDILWNYSYTSLKRKWSHYFKTF